LLGLELAVPALTEKVDDDLCVDAYPFLTARPTAKHDVFC
jgi:hypothetical protein